MADIMVNTSADETDGGNMDGESSVRDTLAPLGNRTNFAEGVDGTTLRLDSALGALMLTAGADIIIGGDSDGDGEHITTFGDGDTRFLTIASDATLGSEDITLTSGHQIGTKGADGTSATVEGGTNGTGQV